MRQSFCFPLLLSFWLTLVCISLIRVCTLENVLLKGFHHLSLTAVLGLVCNFIQKSGCAPMNLHLPCANLMTVRTSVGTSEIYILSEMSLCIHVSLEWFTLWTDQQKSCRWSSLFARNWHRAPILQDRRAENKHHQLISFTAYTKVFCYHY